MGVEYRHFLVAAEPAWTPQADTFLRIDAVLRKWSLVAGDPDVYDISAGKQRRLRAIPSLPPGPGVAIKYPMVEGPQVTPLFGPSYYPDIPDEDRYLQAIWVVAGLDYRVHWSSEGLYFQVVAPARDGDREIESDPDSRQNLYLFFQSYPSTSSTTPPKVEITVDRRAKPNVAFQGYSGYWRAAVVLDCGKDLPGYLEGPHRLPSRAFVAEVSQAFGASLHEVGEIY